ncbi:Sugar kinase of the NBD/HSP70 family, may contain an N-terminal HTH domain [Faunimonas pinastri]|uniref:Sugar kinase of the NBD/HSP70 family, may contain an N-terminal HTH domain n=1 Tax=Faunimonas pinastri TaxID=1855383 RepID=A0A1H9PBS8_9HYPH|nr:ROK family transcriptional regulator [Faunimonas pinastri]SER45630.1 Sugar kinase of the NBD/HSP70 family, may contain an N-terminal HTH domain [Faunimonas pinastri]
MSDFSAPIGSLGTNLTHARSHNYRVVLNVIRNSGPISRAAIAERTSLTRQTVHNIVADMQRAGLVTLGDPLAGSRGAPSSAVALRPEGAYSLGLLLDQFGLIGVVTDLAGQIVAREDLALPDQSVATVLAAMARLSARLRQRLPEYWPLFVGAGLALPGPFDVHGMSGVGRTAIGDWSSPEMVRALSDRLGLPVLVENDASAAAVAEHLHGAARGFGSFAYVYFGVGLGAGIFTEGHLYRGRGGNAGEIGHMVVEIDGLPCPCGKCGCLERYVSIDAAVEALRLDGDSGEVLRQIDERLAGNDPELMGWMDGASVRLRQGINVLEAVLDADAIILGGRPSRAFFEALVERTLPLMPSVAVRGGEPRPRLLIGSADIDTPAHGAAALPIFAEFNPQLDALLKM